MGSRIGPWSDGISLGAGDLPATVISPTLILVLCVVAGIGTVMLLPTRREAAIRKIGGVILLAATVIFAALVVRFVGSLNVGGMSIYFWVFSATALAGSIRVITHPRPVYSALYFVLTVFASAGLFVLLWAEFMAAALVLIYAGAILVTYVFVIMLATQAQPSTGQRTSIEVLAEYDTVSREPFVASLIGFGLMGVLLLVIFDKAPGRPLDTASTAAATRPAVAPGSAQALGHYLFRNQVLNLELAGLLLTVGMIGAILIARRRVAGAEQVAAGQVAIGPAEVSPAAERFETDDDPHAIPVQGTDNPRAKAYPEE